MDDAIGSDSQPKYPTAARIAGIAWIIVGSVSLLNLPHLQWLLAHLGCAAIIIGLISAAFLLVGVQTTSGTARDTQGNGIGSILFGILNLGGGAMQAGAGELMVAGIHFLSGAGLILAGVLALVARSGYRAWRESLRFG